MSEQETTFQRGDLVWCRTDRGHWQRGIVTDVFTGPLSKREVVAMGGDGYYTDDVMPDPGEGAVPEPQSLRVAP